MGNLLNIDDFGLKIYNRFPNIYKEEDLNQRFALKRYLQVLLDGGFKYIIEDSNGLLDLVNPSTIDGDLLQILSDYYGMELFHGIPEQYVRQLIPHISTLLEKKGSLDVIEYIASIASGIQVTTTIEYSPSQATFGTGEPFGYAIFDSGGSDVQDTTTLYVRFDMDVSLSDYIPNPIQMKRLLFQFLPFYLDLLLIYSYIYSSEILLNVREDFLDYIVQKQEETASLFRIGKMSQDPSQAVFNVGIFGDFVFNGGQEYEFQTEYCEDSIKTIYPENFSLNSEEEEEIKSITKNTDSMKTIILEKVDTTITEYARTNSTFGHSKFGPSVFNDTTMDVIHI